MVSWTILHSVGAPQPSVDLAVIFPTAYIDRIDPATEWLETWIAADPYCQSQIGDFRLVTTEAKEARFKRNGLLRGSYSREGARLRTATVDANEVIGLILPLKGLCSYCPLGRQSELSIQARQSRRASMAVVCGSESALASPRPPVYRSRRFATRPYQSPAKHAVHSVIRKKSSRSSWPPLMRCFTLVTTTRYCFTTGTQSHPSTWRTDLRSVSA